MKDEYSLFGSRLHSTRDSNGEYESFVRSSITISFVQTLLLSRFAKHRHKKHHPCDRTTRLVRACFCPLTRVQICEFCLHTAVCLCITERHRKSQRSDFRLVNHQRIVSKSNRYEMDACILQLLIYSYVWLFQQYFFRQTDVHAALTKPGEVKPHLCTTCFVHPAILTTIPQL